MSCHHLTLKESRFCEVLVHTHSQRWNFETSKAGRGHMGTMGSPISKIMFCLLSFLTPYPISPPSLLSSASLCSCFSQKTETEWDPSCQGPSQGACSIHNRSNSHWTRMVGETMSTLLQNKTMGVPYKYRPFLVQIIVFWKLANFSCPLHRHWNLDIDR